MHCLHGFTQVEMRGEALKVYDLKRRLGLPGRRLRAYCNVPRKWRWDERKINGRFREHYPTFMRVDIQSNEFHKIEYWINVALFGIWYFVSLWGCECNIAQFGDDVQTLLTLSVLQALWFSRGLHLPCGVSWWQSWKQRSCPRISRWLLPKIVANRTASRGRPAEVSDFDAGIWISRSFARILVVYLLAVLRAWLMGPRSSL